MSNWLSFPEISHWWRQIHFHVVKSIELPLIVRFRKVNTKSANKSILPQKFENLASNLLIIQHILLKMPEIVLCNPFVSSTTTFPGYSKHNGWNRLPRSVTNLIGYRWSLEVALDWRRETEQLGGSWKGVTLKEVTNVGAKFFTWGDLVFNFLPKMGLNLLLWWASFLYFELNLT